MQKVKNFIISVISFAVGLYFFYVGINMTKKYGFSIFEGGGNAWLTGHKSFERLGEFICGFMVAMGGCINDYIYAFLFFKNTNNESKME